MNHTLKVYFINVLNSLFHIENHMNAEYKGIPKDAEITDLNFRNVRSSIRISGRKVKMESDLDQEYAQFVNSALP